MNEGIKSLILSRIESYDKIIICRHFRPDGDAIGSTVGLKEILSLTYKDKDIRFANTDYSDFISFLGPEGESPSDEFIKASLAIILDTATLDRLSDKRVLNAKEIIKIDHHTDVNPYGDISWVESDRSSTSELIAEFYETFKDRLLINSHAAEAIYTGMNTDSGRFRFASTTGKTLRLAGLMLDQGFDLETLQAKLDLKDIKVYKYQAEVFDKIKITENGLAYLFVDLEMQDKYKLTREEASDSVTFMNMIKGAIAWIAFIENPDKTIRVRLRSRFMTIDKIAEKYHGGGHDRAAGATCYSKEEMDNLIKDADEAVRVYKAAHDNWL